MVVRQYNIVLVNLSPTIGHEMNKTRPCVVISPDEMNLELKTIVVAPLTSNLTKAPSRIQTFLDNKKGMIVLDQIKTIDKSRVIKVFGSLSLKEISLCKSAMKQLYVD